MKVKNLVDDYGVDYNRFVEFLKDDAVYKTKIQDDPDGLLISDNVEADTVMRDFRAWIAKSKGMLLCPKCGKSILANSTFCSHCGEQILWSKQDRPDSTATVDGASGDRVTEIGDSKIPESETSEQEEIIDDTESLQTQNEIENSVVNNPKKLSSRKLLIIVLVVVIVVVCIIAIAIGLRSHRSNQSETTNAATEEAPSETSVEGDPVDADTDVIEAALIMYDRLKGYALNEDEDSFAAMFSATSDYEDYYELEFPEESRDVNAVLLKEDEDDDYSYISITDYTVDGTFPDSTVTAKSYGIVMTVEDDHWTFVLLTDDDVEGDFYATNQLPSELPEAVAYGRNYAWYNSMNYMYMYEESVYKGAAYSEVKFAWQNEDGSVVLVLWLVNGSESEVCFGKASDITLLDDESREIINLSGITLDKTVDAMSSKLVQITIDADDVPTGTDEWRVILNVSMPITFSIGEDTSAENEDDNDDSSTKEADQDSESLPVGTEDVSDAHTCYSIITELTVDDLTISDGRYSYWDITLVEDDVEWLEMDLNTEGIVEAGAMYRGIAYNINHFDEIEDEDEEIALFYLTFGISQPDTDEECEKYIASISDFVLEDSGTKALNALMKKFKSLDCVEGTFDFENLEYEFKISDLEEAAKEMGISQNFLGCILGELKDYDFDIEFPEYDEAELYHAPYKSLGS